MRNIYNILTKKKRLDKSFHLKIFIQTNKLFIYLPFLEFIFLRLFFVIMAKEKNRSEKKKE